MGLGIEFTAWKDTEGFQIYPQKYAVCGYLHLVTFQFKVTFVCHVFVAVAKDRKFYFVAESKVPPSQAALLLSVD